MNESCDPTPSVGPARSAIRPGLPRSSGQNGLHCTFDTHTVTLPAKHRPRAAPARNAFHCTLDTDTPRQNSQAGWGGTAQMVGRIGNASYNG